MSGKLETTEGWLARPMTLPVGIVFGLLFTAGPAAYSSATAEPDASKADIQQLHDEVLKLSLSVEQLSATIAEVKKIEEDAHPRFGVPPRSPPP